MLNAIIIDDEAKNRRGLQLMIEEYCTDVKILATTPDVLTGIKAIEMHTPDIVFLDIEMPNYSGFKLIEHYVDQEVTFEIIITTGIEKHALRAFNAAAIAYLLKPISINALTIAIDKVKKTKSNKHFPKKNTASNAIINKKSGRISLPANNMVLFLDLKEIFYLKSEGRHTHIYFEDNTFVTTNYNLKDCEKLLENTTFLRVHRSYIVNLSYLKRYSKGRDSFIVMENDALVYVGKQYKDPLNEVITFFSK